MSRFVALAKTYQSGGFGFIAVNSNDPVGYPGDSIDEMKKQSSAGEYSFQLQSRLRSSQKLGQLLSTHCGPSTRTPARRKPNKPKAKAMR